MSKSSGSRMWNALGGKAARACDSCLLKRARWFCAADDAFLCQACDVSVHSANQLAHRHERVRLETSSWHQGFTRKARTPRHAKLTVFNHQLPLVPEINLQDPENEEHLLYRVPVFDTEGIGNIMLLDEFFDEFAGDVKSLLGTGLEEECDSGVGRVENNGIEDFLHAKKLKVEDDCDDQVQALIEDIDGSQVNKRMLLKLNYEAVITSWATQSSPWTNGTRPQFNIDEFMAACLERGSHLCGGVGANDSEREARVSRYREKRRTRLFSKKIRYQVRKLNAEKRPRMKGRFVKTTFHTLSRVKYTT